ncbi:MAG TPA: peptide-methionine (S)-S-oxide reductase MsrA [Burkholderiales bacterium]|nr:peptide-methionine (S)-S-oxide reductase MsrA [Burkholderiales bacterium]
MDRLKRWLWIALVCSSAFNASAYAQSKPAAQSAPAKATFAGGCFWCMEEAYEKLPGVISAVSGYMGGRTKNPTYEQVSTGSSGHAEIVQVQYDPSKITYEKLVEAFWRNVDPTQRDGQFCDHGSQYRSAIFYHGEEQKKAADASRAALEKSKPFKGEIVTQIVPAAEFYPAEEYHQDYYKKNPVRYKVYKTGCGREARLQAVWGRRE